MIEMGEARRSIKRAGDGKHVGIGEMVIKEPRGYRKRKILLAHDLCNGWWKEFIMNERC